MTSRFVALFPYGEAPFKVAVAVDEGGSTEPFECSGRQTLWSRRLRAGVSSASGAMLDECVLHIPTEDIGDLTGGELDRRWTTLHQMLIGIRSGGAEGFFPELVLPADGDTGTLSPTVYCSTPGAFFELPCPQCFATLETCRDDALLAGNHLPLYSTTSTRLLTCPKCTVSGSSGLFVDPWATEPDAQSETEVLSAIAYLGELGSRLSESKLPKASQRFCCSQCPEQEQCWSWASEKEDGNGFETHGLEVVGSTSEGPRWRVLTNHSVPFLLTRPAMTPFDAFVREVGSSAARASRKGESEEQADLLFKYDASGMDAVEILTLRLTAFGQAVRAVREHHRLFGRPHLDISTESLVVATEGSAFGLPRLWNFRVRIEATSAVDTLDLGHGVRVPIPPDDPVAPFFSPTVREFMLTGDRIGELRIEKISSEDDGQWRIEGRLLDPRGVYPKPGTNDWIRLQWTEDPCGLGVGEAAARIDPRAQETDGRQIVHLTTEPLPVDAAAAAKVEKVGGAALTGVNYRVYSDFGPRDDLYSLGLVFFMCVLVNDAQDLGLVTDDLGLMGLDPSEEGSWLKKARDQCTKHPETWGTNAILYDSVDRTGERPNAIPDELWFEILALGLRMVAARSDLIVEGESGSALFEKVEAEVESILRRLRGLMFDRQSLNLEVQTLISDLIAEEQKGQD
jgi:hypothetical protein